MKELYYYYRDSDEVEKTKQIANEIIRIGEKNKSAYFIGTGHRILGDYYHNLEKEELATEHFLIAVNLLEKTNSFDALITVYTNLGGVYNSVGDLNKLNYILKKHLAF